jgi:3-hydroxyacyl-CoA dehydrogenase
VIQSSFRKVAILGAGVMGAQIAAHLANAKVPVILFDLAAKEPDPKNGIATKAIANLARLSPAPLADASLAQYIDAANYEEHLDRLGECDLIIEAIAERMDWKHDLYNKIAPHLRPEMVFASNTSGLSITALAEAVPEAMRPRFCGVHFFNPPRYMYLVELIPQPKTDPAVLDRLEVFLTSTLGKGVVRAKDTPNFIANRYGIFSMLATMRNAAKYGLAFDVVDDLTGARLGRAKSATFRTADVVGLDTMAHVIKTMADTLPDDPWHAHFKVPGWLTALLEKGALGQKTRAGVYRKVGDQIMVLDLAKRDYAPSEGKASPAVLEILKKRNPAEMFAGLRASEESQAQFLWSIFRDLFHYCAYHLADVADNARDVDLALRWGFGWSTGPFETWQAAGWNQVAQWIDEDIKAGKSLVNAPLPAWVLEPDRKGVHAMEGSYSAATAKNVGRSALTVYDRQLFPPRVLGEKPSAKGADLYRDDHVRIWVDLNEKRPQGGSGDDVLVLSFQSKMHAIGEGVLDGTLRAIELAQKQFKGLVIWHLEEPFCVGADLASMGPALQAGDFATIEKVVDKFQKTAMAIKYAPIPIVAGVRGMALGGGAEYVMHAARVVASLESYIGLVEVGVGLLPAGGGCKEFALRAAQAAQGAAFPFDFVKNAFQTIALAQVGKSAEEARAAGFLRASDIICFNPNEVLTVAKVQTRALYDSGYRPPLKTRGFAVAGRSGIATIESQLVNMRDGGFISKHDFTIGMAIAEALCGGYVEAGSLVDEQWILDIERRHFIELLKNPLTQQRILQMLQTGKPLRN